MPKLTFTHANIWVTDQDDAVAFYTEKLGWEVRQDVTVPEMGNYRWLTLGPPAQPEVAFIVNVPGPPIMDPGTATHLMELIGRGIASGFHFATDDCQATYEELKGRGVEFTEPPTERPYGIDAAFRDPFGHSFRLVEERAAA